HTSSLYSIIFFTIHPPPPTSTLFPYTTLFRSNGKPLTMEDYLATPDISFPFNIHDSSLELDEANAIIVTSAEKAQNLKSRPVYIAGMSIRQCHPHAHYWNEIDEVAADYVAEELYNSVDIKPEDIDVAAIYDCFSW